MNSFVYRFYMRDEMILKTVIFASAFGLVIDSFKTADEQGNSPYRIRFYHGNNIVGYMDCQCDDFSYFNVGKKYPFVLFTPVGNITGYYSSYSHENSFIYQLDLYHPEEVDIVSGHFHIARKKSLAFFEDEEVNYSIGTYANAFKNGERVVDLSTNYCVSQQALSIRDYRSFEEITYGYYGDFYIYHRKIENREEKILSKIAISNQRYPDCDGSFTFVDTNKGYSIHNMRDKKGNILFDVIHAEIKKHDPCFFETLNRVRDAVTFPVYGGNISLYDRFIHLSFENNEELFSIFQDCEVKALKKENPLVRKYQHRK